MFLSLHSKCLQTVTQPCADTKFRTLLVKTGPRLARVINVIAFIIKFVSSYFSSSYCKISSAAFCVFNPFAFVMSVPELRNYFRVLVPIFFISSQYMILIITLVYWIKVWIASTTDYWISFSHLPLPSSSFFFFYFFSFSLSHLHLLLSLNRPYPLFTHSVAPPCLTNHKFHMFCLRSVLPLPLSPYTYLILYFFFFTFIRFRLRLAS